MSKTSFFATIVGILVCGLSPSVFAGSDVTAELTKKIRMVRHMALNPLLTKVIDFSQDTLDASQKDGRENFVGSLAADYNEESLLSENVPLPEGLRESSEAPELTVIKRFIDNNNSFSELILISNDGKAVIGYPEEKFIEKVKNNAWIKRFQNKNDQLHIGEIKIVPNSNVYKTHISTPVQNRNQTIGVLVVGVLLDE